MLQAVTFGVIALLTVIDQITKYIVDLYLKPIGTADFIPGLRFNYLENTGAAFGSLTGSTVILSILTALVLVVLLIVLGKKLLNSKILHWAVVLITAGGIGNLIDRVFKGYVTDFLEFTFIKFPVFNFADCLITVGAAVAIIYLVYDIIVSVKKEKAEKAAKEQSND